MKMIERLAKEYAETITNLNYPSAMYAAWPSHDQLQSMERLDPKIGDFMAGFRKAREMAADVCEFRRTQSCDYTPGAIRKDILNLGESEEE